MGDLLVDIFRESHSEAPAQIVLDLDATGVPLHGQQERRFFHGHCDSYCYLPLYIFCGDRLLCARLRPADIDAAKAGRLNNKENPRYVATTLSSQEWPAQRLYEPLYCARGDMENRIKEQGPLFHDRLSAATMRSNQLRLYLSGMAYVLVHGLRRLALAGTEWANAQVATLRTRLLKIGAVCPPTGRKAGLLNRLRQFERFAGPSRLATLPRWLRGRG
jgi:hypothetical protein